MSRTKQDGEMVTKYMDRVPIPIVRANTHKLIWSMPRIYYRFALDLAKNIDTLAHKQVSVLKSNIETISREWKGRFKWKKGASIHSDHPSLLTKVPSRRPYLLQTNVPRRLVLRDLTEQGTIFFCSVRNGRPQHRCNACMSAVEKCECARMLRTVPS